MKVTQDPVLACSQTASTQPQFYLVPSSWSKSCTSGPTEMVFLWTTLCLWTWVSLQIVGWTWLLWCPVLPQRITSSHPSPFHIQLKQCPDPLVRGGRRDTLVPGYQQSEHDAVRQGSCKTWPDRRLDIHFPLGEEWIPSQSWAQRPEGASAERETSELGSRARALWTRLPGSESCSWTFRLHQSPSPPACLWALPQTNTSARSWQPPTAHRRD